MDGPAAQQPRTTEKSVLATVPRAPTLGPRVVHAARSPLASGRARNTKGKVRARAARAYADGMMAVGRCREGSNGLRRGTMELRSRMLGGHPESDTFAPSRSRQAIGVPRETGSGAAAPAKGPPPCWRTATKKIATYLQCSGPRRGRAPSSERAHPARALATRAAYTYHL